MNFFTWYMPLISAETLGSRSRHHSTPLLYEGVSLSVESGISFFPPRCRDRKSVYLVTMTRNEYTSSLMILCVVYAVWQICWRDTMTRNEHPSSLITLCVVRFNRFVQGARICRRRFGRNVLLYDSAWWIFPIYIICRLAISSSLYSKYYDGAVSYTICSHTA